MKVAVAVVDKCPGRVNYSNYFNFEFHHYHLCSENKPKILKADVDLDLSVLDDYEFTFLDNHAALLRDLRKLSKSLILKELE